MVAAQARAVEQVVNAVRYPLAAPGSSAWQNVVSRVRDELANFGCSVLPGFIDASSLAPLREECATVASLAHYDVETVNAYNTDVHSPLPADHPGRITVERGNAFVARDNIPADFIVHRLYSSVLVQHLVASCFGLPRVHELGDPLSGLCLNVIKPGMEHPWHFDINEFTVTLMTQAPEDGGTFEYCPNIRSAKAENFGAVRSVLTGEGGHLVRQLILRPGDLQLFKGRYTLHRVNPVLGGRARHTAILAYSERPGIIGSVARTRQLFGRVLPEHIAAEGHAVRADPLLD